MKSTIKIAEGVAVGMLLGSVAYAMWSAKPQPKNNVKKKVGKAVKTACDFLDDMLN